MLMEIIEEYDYKNSVYFSTNDKLTLGYNLFYAHSLIAEKNLCHGDIKFLNYIISK